MFWVLSNRIGDAKVGDIVIHKLSSFFSYVLIIAAVVDIGILNDIWLMQLSLFRYILKEVEIIILILSWCCVFYSCVIVFRFFFLFFLYKVSL